MAEKPVISVIVAAYNHEELVGRAIESALAQVTGYSFEIVVGEDCSTDRTREIVCGYADKYPQIVRVLCNAVNMGLQRNIGSMLRACQGRYIAYLDADDYWTYPGKLQKQVQFLESHPDYSATSHNVRSVRLSGAVADPCYPGLPTGPKTMDDLIAENFVPSPSIVFRNTITNRIPDWYYPNPPADWPLWMLLAMEGPFMHFARVMADYTLHPQSTWSSRGPLYQCEMELIVYHRWRSFLPAGYQRLIRSCEGIRHERRSRAFIKENNWAAARKSAFLAATVPDWRDHFKDKGRIVLDACLPGLMKAFRTIRGASSIAAEASVPDSGV